MSAARMRSPGLVLCLAAVLQLAACGRVDRAPGESGVSVDIPSWAKVAPEQIEAAKKAGVPVAFENSIGMRFVLIPAGTFTMGSPPTENLEAHPRQDEVQHQVVLSKAFYLSICEVTNGQYRKFRPDHRCAKALDGDNRPAVDVTYPDAIAFLSWLGRRDPGVSYRLPTEAEWEYACRAGTTTAFSFGPTRTPEQAPDGPGLPTDVGSYAPNPWGLHDTHGNAWEWCSDWYGEYPHTSTEDPPGPAVGEERVLRGGSLVSIPWFSRSAYRSSANPERSPPLTGIRAAAEFPEK